MLFVISSPAANGRSRRYFLLCPTLPAHTSVYCKVNCPCITTTTDISHYDIDDTVDGRNPYKHLGCIKVCIDNGTFTISAGARFLASTVLVLLALVLVLRLCRSCVWNAEVSPFARTTPASKITVQRKSKPYGLATKRFPAMSLEHHKQPKRCRHSAV